MSNVKYTEVKITDLFIPENGSGEYTKNFCVNNKGNYPVYSGTTNGEFAVVNKYDYDGTYLTWAKDGLAGYIMCLTGKFSITNHRGILVPTEKCQNIDMEYIKYILEPIFRSNVKGRKGHDGQNEYTTLNTTMIRKIKTKIPVPVKSDGTFDVDEQRSIAKLYRKLDAQRSVLISYRDKLRSLIISANFASQYNHREVDLTELFTPQRGNSKYTKTYCYNNRGKFPIYSANNNEPLSYANFYDYDGTYLTVSVNGIAGKITKKEGKFSINADRVILVPNIKNIDLDYVKYTVEPILRSKIKGRMGHDGQNEFTKLPGGIIEKVKIFIPVNNEGDYDLAAQQEIADKYRKIQHINNSICQKIEELVEIRIVI